jgi:hypothetical protein
VFGTLTPYEAILFVILRLAPEEFRQATVVAKWQDRTYRFGLGNMIDKETKRLIESMKILHGDTFEESLRILFGDRDWCNAIAIIVEEWSPDHYFQFVNVRTVSSAGDKSSFRHSPPHQKGWKKKDRLRRRKQRQKKLP